MTPAQSFVNKGWSHLTTSVDLEPYGPLTKGVYICRIATFPRDWGKGQARFALQRLCDGADRAGITLYLEIAPDPGVDYDRLRDFYESFGFRPWMGVFKRRPRVVSSRTS